MRPGRIISGGQTGADQAGLRAAKALGIPTGGWAPLHYLTERGQERWLKTQFGLKEHSSRYMTPRTIANLMEADATVIFGDLRSLGSRQTYKQVRAAHKPVLVNPTHAALAQWVADMNAAYERPVTLNVAGNRHSANLDIDDYVFAVIVRAWEGWTRGIATPVEKLPRLFDVHGNPPQLPANYIETLHFVKGPKEAQP